MGLFNLFKSTLENERKMVEIVKDSSHSKRKRMRALKKIKDQTLLNELASYRFPQEGLISNVARNKAFRNITLEDLLKYNLSQHVYVHNVKDISNQQVLIWLAEHGKMNSCFKTVRECALDKITDQNVKTVLKEKLQADEEKQKEAINASRAEREAKQKAQVNEWKQKGLCPQCGGNFKYEIRTRQINPNIEGYMAYESRNLEPIEEGVCLKCGYKFISKGPEEVQERWRQQNQ